MLLLNPTRRKLLGSMFWLYSLLGLNAIVPLAVLPYLVRVLGVERFGLVAFAQAFAQYFVMASRSRDLALAFIRKSLVWIGVLSFVPSVLLLLFAHPIALILLGKAAECSVGPLRWISMLPFIIAVSGVLAVQTMIPLGMEKQLSRIDVVAVDSSLRRHWRRREF